MYPDPELKNQIRPSSPKINDNVLSIRVEIITPGYKDISHWTMFHLIIQETHWIIYKLQNIHVVINASTVISIKNKKEGWKNTGKELMGQTQRIDYTGKMEQMRVCVKFHLFQYTVAAHHISESMLLNDQSVQSKHACRARVLFSFHTSWVCTFSLCSPVCGEQMCHTVVRGTKSRTSTRTIGPLFNRAIAEIQGMLPWEGQVMCW